MRVMYINHDLSGYANHMEVAEGTTVQQFFEQQMPHDKPNNYLIRVNRLPCAPDQCLVNDDRISITPLKIQGAR